MGIADKKQRHRRIGQFKLDYVPGKLFTYCRFQTINDYNNINTSNMSNIDNNMSHRRKLGPAYNPKSHTHRYLCPNEFKEYFSYIYTIGFMQKPDYEYLRNIFVNLYEKNGYAYDNTYDWDIIDAENSKHTKMPVSAKNMAH